jgi:hypothetical protein
MVEYQEVQGFIPAGEDGSLVVIVDEDAKRTAAIFIERRGKEVFVTTDIGLRSGEREVRIPIGDRPWGPAGPVIEGARQVIDLASSSGPESIEMAKVGVAFVANVVEALRVRGIYPRSDD